MRICYGKMNLCIGFVTLLSCLIGSSHSTNVAKETTYKNCLTWRDDKDWLYLMCRVHDFVLPVTFYHNGSNTEVKCRILKDERGCIPKEKNITIDESSHTVTLVLYENKTERHLEGSWYCKQGDSTQITDVSFAQGIKNDAAIFLRGTVGDESEHLNIECSSCRRPKGPYIEVIMNGKTVASFRQTEEKCWYNDILCSESNICECTETQNAFSLRLHLPNVSNSTNITCYMQFFDTYRGITFASTVTHRYVGEDFKKEGNEITVIHTYPNPTATDYLTRETTVVQTDADKSTSTIKTNSNGTLSTEKYIDKDSLIIVAALSVVSTVYVLFCIRYIRRKRKKRNKSKARTLIRYKVREFDNKICQLCTNSSIPTAANLFCFDCFGNFCLACTKKFHDLHITVPITSFPSSFDPVLFFKCHDDNPYRYICEKDNVLRCNTCKDECKEDHLKEIFDISTLTINSYANEYMSSLETWKKELNHYLKWLHDGRNAFTTQQKTYSSLKQEENQIEYWTDMAHNESEINNMLSKITNQQELLEFLNIRAESCHLFIAINKLKHELTLMERKSVVLKKSFYRLDVSKEGDVRKLYLYNRDKNVSLKPELSADNKDINQEISIDGQKCRISIEYAKDSNQGVVMKSKDLKTNANIKIGIESRKHGIRNKTDTCGKADETRQVGERHDITAQHTKPVEPTVEFVRQAEISDSTRNEYQPLMSQYNQSDV